MNTALETDTEGHTFVNFEIEKRDRGAFFLFKPGNKNRKI